MIWGGGGPPAGVGGRPLPSHAYLMYEVDKTHEPAHENCYGVGTWAWTCDGSDGPPQYLSVGKKIMRTLLAQLGGLFQEYLLKSVCFGGFYENPHLSWESPWWLKIDFLCPKWESMVYDK